MNSNSIDENVSLPSLEERGRFARLHHEKRARLREEESSEQEYLPYIPEARFDEIISNVKPELVGWKLNNDYFKAKFASKIKNDQGKYEGRNLRTADFRWVDLWGVSFGDPHLYKAKFQGAQLSNANFGASDVAAACFWDSDLGDADLSRVRGLSAENLAGAKLTNTILPRHLTKFDRLNHADKTAQSAKATFIALMAACLYCRLTIGTIEDADLLLHASKSPLPVINTAISLIGPSILLAMYVYFQFYLHSLWRELAMLPAVFPDGETLDEKIDPWPLRLLASHHIWRLRLERKRSWLEHTQYWVAVFLGWFVVPITIFWFWRRYLPVHHWGSWVLLGILLIALLIMGG